MLCKGGINLLFLFFLLDFLFFCFCFFLHQSAVSMGPEGANKTKQQKTTTTKTKHGTEHIHARHLNQTWHRKGIKTETQFLFSFFKKMRA